MAAADWIWTWDDAPSDLSGPGDNFDKRMLAYAEDSGDIQVDITFNSTEGDFFFSLPGQPGQSDWRVGPWRATVDVTQANSKVSLAIGLARVGPTGTFKAVYATPGASVVLSAPGLHTFVGTTIAQSGVDAGDRLRVLFQWTRDATFGGNGIVKFGYGDPSRDTLSVPILMANPKIVWNGNTLNFPGPLTGYKAQKMLDESTARSGGVVHATALAAAYYKIRVMLDRFDNNAFWLALRAWWSWAAEGQQYAFALDSADVVDKTLNGSAAAGQKDIPMADTSSVVVGQIYLVRQAIGQRDEIVQVASVTLNTKVTAVANLLFSYISGDIFRSVNYFPKLVRSDADQPFEENPGVTYSLDHTAEEDRG